MAADAKPSLPSPGLYDPAHDSDLEKMMDAYVEAHEKKHFAGYQRASTLHHDAIYETAKKHLAKLHGADGDGPTKLHFTDYKDPKNEKDPKAALKAAEEHLNEQILKVIELRYGKKRADAVRADHKEDPEQLKMYADRILAPLQMNYQMAVKAVQDSENILEDMRNGESILGKMMDAYTQFTSPLQKKIGKYMETLQDEANREAVVSYGSKKLEGHGKKRGHDLTFKPTAKNSDVLKELAQLTLNPDAYMPNPKAKHLRKKPEDKPKK
jgi:hypothetical protein